MNTRTCLLALASCTAAARAQSFNVDIGDPAFGSPSPSFAGAAAQPGTWSPLNGTTGSVARLLDLSSGAPTHAWVEVIQVLYGNVHFDDPGTTGDVELLLDDYMDGGDLQLLVHAGNGIISVRGLLPGVYDLYMYGYSPDIPERRAGAQLVSSSGWRGLHYGGRVWQGALLYDGHYTQTRLQVEGAFTIVFQEYALNGFQLVYQPGAFGSNTCGPNRPNSTGLPAFVLATGSTVAASDDLSLVATQVPPNRVGYFLAGTSPYAFPCGICPGASGYQCIGGLVVRLDATLLNSGPSGRLELQVPLDPFPTTPPHTMVAGETWSFQAWFRDANPAPTSNYSDAVTIAFY